MEIHNHNTGHNVVDFLLAIVSVTTVGVAKFLSELSPLIGFITLLLGLGIGVLTFYNQYNIARKYWLNRKK